MRSELPARGRPSAQIERRVRGAILDAAETAFAENGFGGASMRAIARSAGVNQAMIHYYFQSKEGLFSEVIGRRAGGINAKREQALESLMSDGLPSLEELMEGLLRPTLKHGENGRTSDYSYARLIVDLGNASDERSRALVAQHYDPIAKRYIAALKEILPGLDDATAVEGYLYSISVALSVMARTGRAQKLARHAGVKRKNLCSVDNVVAFVCAGLRALASQDDKRPNVENQN